MLHRQSTHIIFTKYMIYFSLIGSLFAVFLVWLIKKYKNILLGCASLPIKVSGSVFSIILCIMFFKKVYEDNNIEAASNPRKNTMRWGLDWIHL